ncbi:hypothetical protein NIES2119_16310 [[Phormidium ambiguum] IAM M-71]|uniref:Uncharacterized protein n=1 Tax=[Phormidium ambiguum] IAM M-71 TaxID=454136 RepID=A0A1U7IHR1_9CYAN|nr:caspase family protein [Phormidium ambiguum]OKH36593.1 hypothetical protein NIES2119_16310 [Phormidium ambiguum IAM M-71]
MARYALVIGISEYQSPRLGNLQKPVADAEAVAQILVQYGDFQTVKRFPVRWKDQNTAELATKKVTGVELGRELKTFLQEQAAHHEALIYFSGHGFTVYDNLGQQKGYLAASDCQVEVGENHQVSEQRYGISLDSFNELIRDSQLSSLVVLLDCCHSGYFLERQLIKQTLTAFSSQKDYYLITACRSYEDALAIKTEDYSIFTNVVLKGLAPENASRNRRVSGDRLFDYVSSELKAVFQEPIRMGWGRSIILVTYPQLKLTPNGEKEFNRENPYRGLYSFESEQAQYFFGREQAIRALLDRINNNRFLAVIGASGCGKSSLVKAGLLAYLKDNQIPGSSQWEIEIFTPGKHPLTKLIEILDRQHKQNQPFVIFIDQLEEIFTLCEDDAERQSFIHLMAEEVTNSDRLTRIIVTIRTDFLDRCAAYPEAATLINRSHPTTYVVTPLSRSELEEAIKEPATLHGVKFQQGLITQIADDVDDQPGALPLLQYALKELWRVCIEKPEIPEKFLTWKGYKEIRGVKGALENRANLLYQSFSSTDQVFVHRMFMELVQLSDENQVTRRRTVFERLEAIADSIEQLRRVVQLLADQRLIVTDKDTVEVAHEALLTEWNLLRSWIEEDKENIRLSRLLETECHEWQVRFKKSDEALLTGAKLATIAEWKDKNQPKLPVEEAEFLQKSLAKRDREIQEELEQERQLREAAEARAKAEAEKAEQERVAALAKIETALEAEARAKAEAREAEAKTKVQKQRTRFAIVAAILAPLIIGVGLFVEGKKRESDAIAVGALISKAQDNFEKHQQLEALIASIQALDRMKKINSSNPTYLTQLQKVIYNVREHNRLEGHKKIVNAVNYSPNGKIIISGSEDKTIIVWDATGQKIKVISGHKKPIYGISFNHFNHKQIMFASASFDKTVMLWSEKGNKLIFPLISHQEAVFNISFSPDNYTLASISGDGTIKLWDIKTGKLRKTIKDKKWITKEITTAYSIDINPKNKFIIASSGYLDGRFNLWNLAVSEQPLALYIMGLNNNIIITKVKFNHSGTILALASSDGTILLWSVEKNKIIGKIKAHDEIIYSLAFSPNDQLIASGSQDKIVKIWNIKEIENFENSKKQSLLTPIDILRGHYGAINDIQFHPKNSQILVTASDDKTIRIWQTKKQNLNTINSLEINKILKYSCGLVEEYIANKNMYENIRSICFK